MDGWSVDGGGPEEVHPAAVSLRRFDGLMSLKKHPGDSRGKKSSIILLGIMWMMCGEKRPGIMWMCREAKPRSNGFACLLFACSPVCGPHSQGDIHMAIWPVCNWSRTPVVFKDLNFQTAGCLSPCLSKYDHILRLHQLVADFNKHLLTWPSGLTVQRCPSFRRRSLSRLSFGARLEGPTSRF